MKFELIGFFVGPALAVWIGKITREESSSLISFYISRQLIFLELLGVKFGICIEETEE